MAQVTDIALGSGHTCAVISDEEVKCWGRNSLGNGSISGSPVPVDVIGLPTGILATDTGGTGGVGHTCVVTLAGGVKCWGSNFRGDLGDGTYTDRTTPVDVVGLTSGGIEVTTGNDHSCVLMTSGSVKCWGNNFTGQLGDGTRTSTTAPVDVIGLASPTAMISAGIDYTCALSTSGGIQCWGDNHSGRLGAPTTDMCGVTTCTSVPIDVTGLQSGIVEITTGRGHTCALTVLGAVKCWGRNQWGQLGNGTTSPSISPTDVSGLSSGVVSISAGEDHTCVMTSSAGLKCWGYNFWGQLGNGSIAESSTPVDVISLDGDVGLLAAGGHRTCAIMVAGETKCWGHAVYGDIGDNLQCGTFRCTVPVDVLDPSSKPTPTPTDTLTPTPTPTPCPTGKVPTAIGCGTPTPTPTPTDTPTPTATATPGGPEMLLTIKAGDCDDPIRPTTCDVLVGSKFTLSVDAVVAPPIGYILMQTFVHFGSDLIYQPSPATIDEIIWPDCDETFAHRAQFPSDEFVNHGCISGAVPPLPLSNYVGNVVGLSYACSSSPSSTEVRLLPFIDLDPVTATSGTLFAFSIDVIFIPKVSNLTINCVAPPTPLPFPRIAQLPALQNVWLTRQDPGKIPPANCLSGTDIGGLTEQLSQTITSSDPKSPSVAQQIAAFEFEVHYDSTKVCVALTTGAVWSAAGATCIIEDSASKPQLEGVARIGCVTTGKGLNINDLAALAQIDVRPQPDVYSQAKPNQDNGVVVQIRNVNCDVSDEQGQAIPIFSCDDADITFRYLEGDVEPDCVIDATDAQAIAFRWGVSKGSLIYKDFMNLEPSSQQADNDIDINDLQFVYGRFGSTCEDPHPLHPPVNPKA